MKAKFLVLAIVLGLVSGPVLADSGVLFDNGSVVEQDGGVRFNVDDDSIYDDFTLTSDSIVTGFSSIPGYRGFSGLIMLHICCLSLPAVPVLQ